MLKDAKAFSGFSVKDAQETVDFYGKTLGLRIEQGSMGMQLHLSDGLHVFVYEKQDHVPAAYTILNFEETDVDAAVDELVASGVVFEHYDMGTAKTDEKGILRGKSVNMGPDIAWFKDPSGNILSILCN